MAPFIPASDSVEAGLMSMYNLCEILPHVVVSTNKPKSRT